MCGLAPSGQSAFGFGMQCPLGVQSNQPSGAVDFAPKPVTNRPNFGVPADAVSLIMGLYPIADMLQTCTNVTGDGVVTTIVSRHEKMLDLKKFNS